MNKKLSDIKNAVPCLFYPIAKSMGIAVSELLQNSSVQADALIKIAQSYPVSAVVRMTELWAEAGSFGMEIDMSENDFPKLSAPLYCEVEDLENAIIPQAVTDITKPLIDAVSLAASAMEKPLIVGVTAPYTLGSVLNGSEDFMVNCMTEPDIVHAFLQKLTEFLIAYILEYKKAGADGVILAEPSIAMISPDMTNEFSNSYIEKIINAVQDDNFFIIYHNCGEVDAHLDGISKLSAKGFHFGSGVDILAFLKKVSPDKIVMGNIDPRLFLSDNTQSIIDASDKLLNRCSGFDNFILSTGCDLSPNATTKTIATFLNREGF